MIKILVLCWHQAHGCAHCLKSFAAKSNLQRHRKAKHHQGGIRTSRHPEPLHDSHHGYNIPVNDSAGWIPQAPSDAQLGMEWVDFGFLGSDFGGEEQAQ
jgi:hypothetical protein